MFADESFEKKNIGAKEGDNNLKVKTGNIPKVSKRKLSCSDEDSDSEISLPNQKKIKILNIEKPKQDFYNKFFKSNKRKIKSPDKEDQKEAEACSDVLDKSQEIPNISISTENDENKCVVDANDSASILKELQPSRSIHSFLIPPSGVNFPTSTPRVDKTRTVLDVKNISPIASFDKENCVSCEQKTHSVVQTDTDQNFGEKISKAESSDVIDNPGAEMEFLKPQSRALKSKTQSKNHALTDSKNIQMSCEETPVEKENTIQNNLIHSQSSETNLEENQACEKNSLNEKNIADGLIDQLNDQRHDLTPKKKNDKIFDKQSFVESPLIFDDPSCDQNQSNKNLLSISNTTSEIAKNLFKTSFKDQENVEFNNTNNESSYYPHEWSNEYDTSFGEFTEKNDNQQNSSKYLINEEVQKSDINSPEIKDSKVENPQHNSPELDLKEITNQTDSLNVENETLISAGETIVQTEKPVNEVKNFENNDESKLLCNNEEQVANKINNSKENRTLETNVKSNNILLPADSELDSQNPNDSSAISKKTDESESKNLLDGKLFNIQNNIDGFETVETNENIFESDLEKEGTTENVIQNETSVKEFDIEKIIKKTCPKYVQIRVKKLDDNYVIDTSPILSKRTFKKSVSIKKNTKNIKKNRTQTEQSRIYKYESNKKKQISKDNKKVSSFKIPSISNENSEKANYKYLASDFKIVKVFITKQDVENAENFLKSQQKKLKYLNSEKINKKSTEKKFALDAKLNDPVKVTMRRNVYKKWDRPLAAIAEGDQTANADKAEGIYRENFGENETSPESRQSKPIFLKPGKSWARSLSIINHFQNNQNLEELAVGRGQNWRKSVQTILNMQSEGIILFSKKYNSNMIEIFVHKLILLNFFRYFQGEF